MRPPDVEYIIYGFRVWEGPPDVEDIAARGDGEDVVRPARHHTLPMFAYGFGVRTSLAHVPAVFATVGF